MPTDSYCVYSGSPGIVKGYRAILVCVVLPFCEDVYAASLSDAAKE
jgi:hypothetical protein